jgi:hypothetical protein
LSAKYDIPAVINTMAALPEGDVMNMINQQDLLDDPRVDAERAVVREALDEIAREVASKLRESGLSLQVFLTLPRIGNAIATIATPADPKEDVWTSVCEIVSQIVSHRLNGMKLRSRELPCAMAGTAMSAADLTSD